MKESDVIVNYLNKDGADKTNSRRNSRMKSTNRKIIVTQSLNLFKILRKYSKRLWY